MDEAACSLCTMFRFVSSGRESSSAASSFADFAALNGDNAIFWISSMAFAMSSGGDISMSRQISKALLSCSCLAMVALFSEPLARDIGFSIFSRASARVAWLLLPHQQLGRRERGFPATGRRSRSPNLWSGVSYRTVPFYLAQHAGRGRDHLETVTSLRATSTTRGAPKQAHRQRMRAPRSSMHSRT